MRILISILSLSVLLFADNFTLTSNDVGEQLTKAQEYQGFGCNGGNISPSLQWKNAPQKTKSFAITMYDPDAPTGRGWWHWIVFNIPKDINSIPTNASKLHLLPKGAVEGMTDYHTVGYGGACPPKGDKAHRYIITVYALDRAKLNVNSKTDPARIASIINMHSLAKSSIVSHYKR